ncbi:hypothetical protein B0H67DRAFT_250176 [Lasiosphaeris hirsuta]|uniref:Uncharacterized protein n=1 Tax=Lasiosphaeris hirsuta TaxID=260670 RepID=A0AA40AH54_9PEZI|nr:hypothetical protein B0H67DRAFT_250176 [Lasiosphaeris hirsuta]
MPPQCFSGGGRNRDGGDRHTIWPRASVSPSPCADTRRRTCGAIARGRRRHCAVPPTHGLHDRVTLLTRNVARRVVSVVSAVRLAQSTPAHTRTQAHTHIHTHTHTQAHTPQETQDSKRGGIDEANFPDGAPSPSRCVRRSKSTALQYHTPPTPCPCCAVRQLRFLRSYRTVGSATFGGGGGRVYGGLPSPGDSRCRAVPYEVFRRRGNMTALARRRSPCEWMDPAPSHERDCRVMGGRANEDSGALAWPDDASRRACILG